jgi:plasmid maintenance system killer
MIHSFKCTQTQALFEGKHATRFANFRVMAERKLQMLHCANTLTDLRVPPNNRLEALKGDRAGQYSIRINDRWRICFIWQDGHALDVEIVDYH